jgi:hypothetical protein
MTVLPHPTTLTLVANQRLAALRTQADRDRLADVAERAGRTGRRGHWTLPVVLVVAALLLAAVGTAMAGDELDAAMDRPIFAGVIAMGGAGPIDDVVGKR